MHISESKKIIFIHIQKNAGTTISKLLEKHIPDAHAYKTQKYGVHMPAIKGRKLLGEDFFSDYFKFAVVRNPWDRIVSWYYYLQKQAKDYPLSNWQKAKRLGKYNQLWQYIFKNSHDFESFVINCEKEIPVGRLFPEKRSPFKNQLDYLTDEHGTMIVDQVLKFEQLNEEVKSLFQQKMGIKVDLIPKVNASKHKAFKDYYSTRTRDLVAERCAKDIAFWGYRFEE